MTVGDLGTFPRTPSIALPCSNPSFDSLLNRPALPNT
jgi:hypothetical protein